MIIEFQGSTRSGNDIGAVASLAAGTAAFAANKKVLLMSLKNHNINEDIEDYALPNMEDQLNSSRSFILDQFSFSDTGIDAAIRRAEAGRFKPENLDNCVTPAARKQNNMDVLRSTKEIRFEEDLAQRWATIRAILETANESYDYVFVYIGSSYNEFVGLMNELADRIVVVVKQGRAEPLPEADKQYLNKTCYVVKDYEQDSRFGVRYLKKRYDAKTIFTLPHNVAFNDAMEGGGVLDFAARNASPEKGDYGYPLASELNKLMKYIADKNYTFDIEEADQFPFRDEIEFVRKEQVEKEALLLHEGVPETETATERKGLFGKRTYEKAVFRPDDGSQDDPEVFDPFDEKTEETAEEEKPEETDGEAEN